MAKSILIADDNPHIRKLLKMFLEGRKLSMVCTEAVDGVDAIEKAHLSKPDLIILDLAMPHMNGLDVARSLKSTMSGVPIVLFTFFSDAVSRSDAAKIGIDAVFSKGDIVSLVQHIEAIFPPPN